MDTARIGLIGLGTMGAALALNIAEKGFDIAVHNRTTSKTHRFHDAAGDLKPRITPTETLREFVDAIARPRAIILMVPAGKVVDDQIADLVPLLDDDDLIIDCGNADFHDTNRRATALTNPFLGVGVSGGEDGARHGPSIMGGGRREYWDRVADVMTAIAARAEDGTPCATWMGEGGAGHFVKAVHNGIEYADMQMIAEVYGMMRDGAGLAASDIAPVFRSWNRGPLASYLIEVTGEVLGTKDPQTGEDIVDLIVDQAGQKGTGRWTVIEAVRMGQAVSILEAAVGARVMSAQKSTRLHASRALVPAGTDMMIPVTEHDLQSALIVGRILANAQGFEILAAGSKEFNWSLDFARIAEIWRAGCIIRSAMLDDIATAFRSPLPAGNLALSDHFISLLTAHIAGLRQVVSAAALKGLPTPALAAALSWFDMIRQERGTSDLIQAQRDYFGAHSFERIDAEGSHHGPWHAG